MTGRIPLDHLTSDQYDQLCDELERLREELAEERTTSVRRKRLLERRRPELEQAEATVARVRALADQWAKAGPRHSARPSHDFGTSGSSNSTPPSTSPRRVTSDRRREPARLPRSALREEPGDRGRRGLAAAPFDLRQHEMWDLRGQGPGPLALWTAHNVPTGDLL